MYRTTFCCRCTGILLFSARPDNFTFGRAVSESAALILQTGGGGSPPTGRNYHATCHPARQLADLEPTQCRHANPFVTLTTSASGTGMLVENLSELVSGKC